MLCIWDTNLQSGQQGGGCNYASDPFAGRLMMTSLSFDGGPTLDSIAEVRIVGVVDASVDSVDMLDAQGKSMHVRLSKDQAFAAVFHQGAIRNGRLPTVIRAKDASGAVIDQQAITLGVEAQNS
jgi:hypothetical protein